MRNIRRMAIPQTVLTIFLCIGCSSIMATPIKKILDNPRDFQGKKVTVAGEVTETFSLLVVKYFTVKDSTGEITVITSRPLPRKGSGITVRGTVQEAFSLGDQQVIVIVEPDDREKEKK